MTDELNPSHSTEIESTATPNSGDDSVGAASSARSRRAAVASAVTLPRLVIGVVLVALIGAVVGLTVRVVHQNRLEEARTSALRSAQQYAVDFSSFDYHNLDSAFSRVSDELTGKFKSDYAATSKSLKTTIVTYQGVATAVVRSAGVSQATPHHAVVTLLLDQTVTSKSSAAPRVDRNRLVMSLERTGSGRWLVSDITLA